MKAIKKFLLFLAALIVALCAGITICAFQPDLTRKLAEKVNRNDGNLVDTIVEDIAEDIGVELPNNSTSSNNSGRNTEYVIPDALPEELPENISGLYGFQAVDIDASQIEQAEADNLDKLLSEGATGENLEFPALYYPYYHMLDNEEQLLYRQIYANAYELNTGFKPVVMCSTGHVKNAFEAVLNDHPELFWLDNGYSCKYLNTGICVEITIGYNSTADNLEESKALFETSAEEILSVAKTYDSTLNQEQYLHDALVAIDTYNARNNLNQSAYSALVSGQTVCAGYARAFQYLCMQLNIPCYYCTGYAGESHAWNIVSVGEGYRNVDVTWDDTDPATYDYYNKTDREFNSTHVRRGLSIYLPACVDGSSDITIVNPVESIADQYINPDPQKPLRWTPKTETKVEDTTVSDEDKKKQNMAIAGVTEEELAETMADYYKKCLELMSKAGTGDKKFTVVIPQSLWDTLEKAYSNNEHYKGYMTEALKALGMDECAIQIQAKRLGGGYIRIYHNIFTYKDGQ